MTDEEFERLVDACDVNVAVLAYLPRHSALTLMDEAKRLRAENARLQEFIKTRDMEIERLRAALDGRL